LKVFRAKLLSEAVPQKVFFCEKAKSVTPVVGSKNSAHLLHFIHAGHTNAKTDDAFIACLL
jgi:hypothetical protein